MARVVTVAIPVLNGGPALEETLAAAVSQQLDRELELVVCDSGSTDGSVALARNYADRVTEIAPDQFSHGGTRNLLMEISHGDHVAFLTQDAVPAGDDWLSKMLVAFELAPDVGLAYGPYLPRSGASPSVSRELSTWFGSLSPTGSPRLDRLEPSERSAPVQRFHGRLGFFTDANGCVARAAWERVPFRQVAYAEDHLLAQDMLRAGFAKVFVPDAAVTHSHEYSPAEWFRRSFDEGRAMREVYDWVPCARLRVVAGSLRGRLAGDLRWIRRAGRGGSVPGTREQIVDLVTSLVHHTARTAGGLLGARADRLPPRLVARLSLEGRPR